MPQSDGGTAVYGRVGNLFHRARHNSHRKSTAGVVAGCPAAGGLRRRRHGRHVPSDLLSRDANWFSRPGRLTISNVSIDAPPLTPNRPVTSDDLVTAEGYCPGMTPPPAPSDANALTDNPAGAPPAPAAAPTPTGTVALGHTECDVVRGIGAPVSVNFSNNPRGDRVAVVTYLQGQRAGIYTFTAGRLSSVERAPQSWSSRRSRRSLPRSWRRRNRRRRRPEPCSTWIDRRLTGSAGCLVIFRTRRQPFFLGALPARFRRRRAPC